jgi:hypothetical protein
VVTANEGFVEVPLIAPTMGTEKMHVVYAGMVPFVAATELAVVVTTKSVQVAGVTVTAPFTWGPDGRLSVKFTLVYDVAEFGFDTEMYSVVLSPYSEKTLNTKPHAHFS